MVDDVHPRDFEILSKVAAGRTLFVDVFALSQLKQAGLVKSVDRGTHTAWELTDAGRKRLEAEKQRREDDARRTSDASASSNAGGNATGAARSRRRGKAGSRKEKKGAGE
jgi:DNA-binding PadR family transcriptional regulator